ncbi:hypothetical protein [Litoreibacter roseus]|uniref:Uncharacterized protein n=1 Tax=Litoreibacter roseus TaxID=2601869 RepID=A0A6N6JCH9_9RHOB|nr:hypothetical protein [Litoreibacter roseus]GFE63687.1 hypothetical protein KIN_07610 [Litoreibacter roseus]
MIRLFTDPHAKNPARDTSDRFSLWPCIAVLMLSLFVSCAMAFSPKQGESVGVLFPPWFETSEMYDRVSQAGGAVVAFGGIRGMFIAIGEDDGFISRLRREGAILVLDGSLSAVLCRTET